MASQAQNPESVGNSEGPSLSEFKAMFAELLDGTKKDILAQVQESIEQVYADFEYVETDPEGGEAGSVTSPDAAAVVTKIDDFVQPKTSDNVEGSCSGSFKVLAEEFSVAQKTSPAIDANLADIVNSLLTEKLSKVKLTEVQNKYQRPENYTDLVAPKINKQTWQ